jgi:hypothetical protein
MNPELMQSSGLDVRDIFHKDSEVYAYLNQITQDIVTKFKDGYLLYLYLIDLYKIIIPDDTLNKRVHVFFLLYCSPIVNFNDVNKLKLLIFAEKYKKIYPIGRPWEKTDNLLAEERFLPTSKYMKTYIENTYERLMLSKRAYELRIRKSDTSQIVIGKTHQYIIGDLQSHFWIQKFFEPLSYEVEIRFQNVSGLEFGKLFNYFMLSDKFYFHNVISHVVILNEGVREILFKESNPIAKPFIQQKRELSSYKNPQWGFKVAVSEEKVLTGIGVDTTRHNRRLKNTFRFYTSDRHSCFFNMEIALSIVVEFIQGKSYPQRKFEVEIERKFGRDGYWKKTVNSQLIQNSIKNILQISRGDYPLDCSEQEQVNFFLCGLIKRQVFNPIKFVANKVLPFSKSRALEYVSFKYFISPKLDGDRKLLLVKSGLGSFLLALDGSIFRVGPFFRSNTSISILLDCEVVAESLHVFDIITHSKYPEIERQTFSERYKQIRSIITWITDEALLYRGFVIYVKPFQPLTKPEDMIAAINIVRKQCKYDGVILQSDTHYYTSHIFKWKPRYMNTIDFMISDNNTPIDIYQNEIKRVNLKINHDILLYTKHFSLKNFVTECFFNPLDGCFYPIKIRFDKPLPNTQFVIDETLKLISEHFSDKNFLGFQLPLARKIINEIKRKLLTSNGKGVLLDIGSGQGGDVDKWEMFDKIIAVEPDKTQYDRLQQRLYNNPTIATKTRVEQQWFSKSSYASILKGTLPDIITAFFSVNFVFESPKTLEGFVDALNNSATHNCPVLMLIHDGNDLIKYVKPIGSGVIDIEEQGNKLNITIVGTEYVKNIVEYAFDTVHFVRVASQFFSVSVSSFVDVIKQYIPSANIEVLSNIEQQWLKSIRLITLVKEKPLDTVEQIIGEEIVGENGEELAEEEMSPEIEGVEIEYPQDDDKITDPFRDVMDEEDDIVILEEEPSVTVEHVTIFHPDYLIESSIGKVYAMDDVNERCLLIFEKYKSRYEECYNALNREYNSLVWKQSKFTYVVLECLLRYELLFDVWSNLDPYTFLSENLLPYEISYQTDGKTLDSLLTNGFIPYNAEFPNIIKGMSKTLGPVTMVIIDSPLKEDFLSNFNFCRLFLPLSHPCIVFVSYGRCSISQDDLKRGLVSYLTTYEEYMDSVNNCYKIFKTYVTTTKESEQLALLPPDQGIVWKGNSCYADSVLMCMGASNMVKIYLNLLSRCDFPISQEVYTIVEQIYRNRKGTLSEKLITELGLTCGEMEDAADFYNKLCDKIPTLNFDVVRKGETSGQSVSTLLKHDMDNQNFRQIRGSLFVVENNTDDAIINRYKNLTTLRQSDNSQSVQSKKIKEQEFINYKLQACVYLLPLHYICVFRRYKQWYLYDGLDKPTVKRIKTFVLSEYKEKPTVPYLLFHSKRCS